MKGTRSGVWSAQARRVQEQFKSWRKSKRGGDRIPEPLWAAAAKLCERHGVSRVSHWLRLNHTALRDRTENKNRRQGPAKGAPAFVEWVSTAPAEMSSSEAEYVLELDGAPGPNLRLRVRGAKIAEIATLARLLRREHE